MTAINLIAAVALNGAIGRNNSLLWHLSEDLKFFKSTTMGHPVIMGRKTFESIGKALPGRLNIVLSRQEPELPEGVRAAKSLQEAIQICEAVGHHEVFVIGGGQIYAEAMKQASTLYVTRVFDTPEDADTFFPAIDADEWNIVSQGETMQDDKSGLEYRFELYKKS